MATHKDSTSAQTIHAADEAWEAAVEAASNVLQDAPSILLLGQMLARSEKAYHAFDVATMTNSNAEHPAHGRRRLIATRAQDLLDERQDALRLLITTQPARTVADAAVQMSAISDIACQLDAHNLDDCAQIALITRIDRMTLGILPVLAEAAGLDMVAMGWAEQDLSLRPNRWTAVGVQA